MNAGCGSGVVSKLVAKKVPRGKVYVVDMDSNMIRKCPVSRNTMETIALSGREESRNVLYAD